MMAEILTSRYEGGSSIIPKVKAKTWKLMKICLLVEVIRPITKLRDKM